MARFETRPRPTVYAPPRGSTIGSPTSVAPAPDAAMAAQPGPLRLPLRGLASAPPFGAQGPGAVRPDPRRVARPRGHRRAGPGSDARGRPDGRSRARRGD